MSKKPVVEIWSDGSTYPTNPGGGGWGAILVAEDRMRIISGWVKHATNNNMEARAVAEALERLTRSCVVTVCTDSAYVINGINAARNGRLLKTNVDVWEMILANFKKHVILTHKVKGHSGEILNEWANDLAQEAAVHQRGLDDYIQAIPETYKKRKERSEKAKARQAARLQGQPV